MVWFEVFIPAKDPALPNVTLTVEAQNWIGALRTGLSNLGEGHEAIANVMCDIKEDNSIHVTDVSTHRVFRLREVPQPKSVAPSSAASASLAPENTLEHPSAPRPTPSRGARPVSMPDMPPIPLDSDSTLPNVEAARPVVPLADYSVPWTKMQGPDEGPATLQLTSLPPPPPLERAHTPIQPVVAPAIIAPAVAAPVVAPRPEAVEPTERIQRAPRPSLPPEQAPRKTGPVPAPTPRGSPAPLPRRTSGQFDAAPQPTRREESPPSPSPAPIGRSAATVAPQAVADAVADVFDATQDLLLEESIAPETIAARLLDIALQHVPAESGSFYLADVNGHELHFAAVRGPKAREIQQKKLSVKVGQGIIGFCALEGVCLSVSDIQKDPRYFSAVADAIGYSPRDTLCASAEKDGRLFGAVQLINSTGGFSAIHMEVLRYIGLTAASLLERHFDNER